MKSFLSFTVVLVSTVVLAGAALAGPPYRAHTEIFNPAAVPDLVVVAEWAPNTGRAAPDSRGANHGLTLGISATVPFPPGASADATIDEVVGDTLISLGLDHELMTHCTGGSPRYSVETAEGSYAFGCASGTHVAGADGWETITFSDADVQVLAGAPWPGFGMAVMTFLQLLQDEGGTTVVDNLMVNGVIIGKPGNNF
jgi:hypothetical protein